MRCKRLPFVVAATLSAALWAYACGDGATEPTTPPTPPPDPPRPTTVTVTPATAELTAIGATVQLSARVLDQNGHAVAGAGVTWSSSAEAVATVDGSGLVTAVADGAATITATAGAASGTAGITVIQSPDSVAVSPQEATLALGDTLRLTAEAFDANGHAVAGEEFSWESSDAAVATVDGSGLVTAAGNGTATITASVGDARGESVITVAVPRPVSIPDANLRSIVEAALGKTRGAPITDIEMQTIESLRVGPGERVRDLTGLDYATNLEVLRIWDNLIEDISPLTGLTNLTTLWLLNNNISDISPLAGLTNLNNLEVWGNRIKDISPLAGLTKLTRLSIAQNNVTDVSPLAGLSNLMELSVGEGPITDLSPLAGLSRLTRLKVFGTGNTADLSPLSGLSNLRELVLSHGQIVDISALAALTGLTGLWLWDNQVEDISALARLTNLVFLSLGKNNIANISPLAGLTDLTELFLNDNDITDVSPLSGLTRLTFLNLSANNITDISPLAGLINLRELYLSANNIRDISPLSNLTNLQDLDLRGNPYETETLPKGDFDIELVLLDEFTESQKDVLEYIARRWMAIITEDLPDYVFSEGWSGSCGSQSIAVSAGDRIDDLRIYVKKERLSVGTLGFGGPIAVREATHLPVLGCMGLELTHANLLITGLHEMAHVLGVGALWSESGYFQNPSDGDEHFNGPLAIAAFDAAGGRNYAGAKVPVEGGHWRGSVFGNELMTPTGTGAISAVTVQSLADLGYVVDITQADSYTLPAAGRANAMQAVVVPGTPDDDRASGRYGCGSRLFPAVYTPAELRDECGT